MKEEKKSIENLQDQETNTDDVKGGFKQHTKKFRHSRTDDGNHMSDKKISKGGANKMPGGETEDQVNFNKLGTRNFRK